MTFFSYKSYCPSIHLSSLIELFQKKIKYQLSFSQNVSWQWGWSFIIRMESRSNSTSDGITDISENLLWLNFHGKNTEVLTMLISYLLGNDLPRIYVSYITVNIFSTKLKQDVCLNVQITLFRDLDPFLCSGLSKDSTKNSCPPL